MDKTYFSHCKKFFHLVSIDKSYFTKCKLEVTLTVIVDILFLKVTYLMADCGWWMCGMFLGLMLDGNCSILTSGGQLSTRCGDTLEHSRCKYICSYYCCCSLYLHLVLCQLGQSCLIQMLTLMKMRHRAGITMDVNIDNKITLPFLLSYLFWYKQVYVYFNTL